MSFPRRKFLVPVQVLTELDKSKDVNKKFKSLIEFLRGEKVTGQVDEFEGIELVLLSSDNGLYTIDSKGFDSLQSGEIACISYCISNKDQDVVFLVDDRKAYRVALDFDIESYTLPEILLLLKVTNIISIEEIKMIIEELREKDRYLFKEEILRGILS
jgi:hypothetical protein